MPRHLLDAYTVCLVFRITAHRTRQHDDTGDHARVTFVNTDVCCNFPIVDPEGGDAAGGGVQCCLTLALEDSCRRAQSYKTRYQCQDGVSFWWWSGAELA